MATSTAEHVHDDQEVFTFCGYIQGDTVAQLKTGFVVAKTPQDAITAMRDCGFIITALSSLAEVRQMIHILDKIAQKDPGVEATEFLDAYPEKATQYPDGSVFCFTGHVVSTEGTLKTGFIVASDIHFVTDYLHGLGFVVESATSLADLRRVMAEMQLIAREDPDIEHSHFINFKAAV